MLELIVGGSVAVYGHIKSKKFVGRKLRYTGVVEKSSTGLGLATGAATALAAGTLAAVLPFVGAGAAVIVGAGVGTGVAAGIKQARKGGPSDDWS